MQREAILINMGDGNLSDGSGKIEFGDFPGFKIIPGKIRMQAIDFADELLGLADVIDAAAPCLRAVPPVWESLTADLGSLRIAFGTCQARSRDSRQAP